MSSAAVRKVIDLASELSDEERRVVVDAIAPPATTASLAAEWEAEIARRVERVKADPQQGRPAHDVFDRLDAKLASR
jgi:putative addiction module component (TIGR02574 family)